MAQFTEESHAASQLESMRLLEQQGPPCVEPLLFTAAQVAALLQVSVRTLWRMRSGGQVPSPVQIGGNVRWRRSDVLRWIEGGCQKGEARENGGRRK